MPALSPNSKKPMNKHQQHRAWLLQEADRFPNDNLHKGSRTPYAISEAECAAVPPPVNLRVQPAGDCLIWVGSGFCTHAVVAVCRKLDVRFSMTVGQHRSLRDLIEAMSEEDWTPIPYWMDGAADVAETTCTPFRSEPDAAPVRLIVRRVKPTPGSQRFRLLMADTTLHQKSAVCSKSA